MLRRQRCCGQWANARDLVQQSVLTERILRQSAALAPLGAIAVQLRERLDGSGYPRGLAGGAISRPGRVLGATDIHPPPVALAMADSLERPV